MGKSLVYKLSQIPHVTAIATPRSLQLTHGSCSHVMSLPIWQMVVLFKRPHVARHQLPPTRSLVKGNEMARWKFWMCTWTRTEISWSPSASVLQLPSIKSQNPTPVHTRQISSSWNLFKKTEFSFAWHTCKAQFFDSTSPRELFFSQGSLVRGSKLQRCACFCLYLTHSHR